MLQTSRFPIFNFSALKRDQIDPKIDSAEFYTYNACTVKRLKASIAGNQLSAPRQIQRPRFPSLIFDHGQQHVVLEDAAQQDGVQGRISEAGERGQAGCFVADGGEPEC